MDTKETETPKDRSAFSKPLATLGILSILGMLMGMISLSTFDKESIVWKAPAAASTDWFKPAEDKRQPHILYVLADDLGWNDIGYHGSFINTPTIDQLASEGVKLERFYMQSICTPSRSELMSGRYTMHTGLQHLHIEPMQPNALTIKATLLPEVLTNYGYRNYMVGKWHLGFYADEYLPNNRGFHKFFGLYTGESNHYTHRHFDKHALVENGVPVWDNTTYDTHMYTDKAMKYVEEHLSKYPNKPMFLFVSYQAVHAPIQVPAFYMGNYANQSSTKYRPTLAGMTTCMDEGIKNITRLFKRKGIWDNTVMFFSTDNGGSTIFGSSNYPLKGEKGTLNEGGVRGPAFVRGKGIKNPGRTCDELIHMTDIYPTIVALAKKNSTKWQKSNLAQAANALLYSNRSKTTGRKAKPQNSTELHAEYLQTLDGYNMWDTISSGAPSPRKEAVLIIDPRQEKWGESLYPDIYDTGVRSAIIVDQWKLLTGFTINPFVQQWYPPAKYINPKLNKTKNVLLYNIYEDPTESNDLFFQHPDVVERLLKRLRHYNQTAVPVSYPSFDNNWSPPRLNGVLAPWR